MSDNGKKIQDDYVLELNNIKKYFEPHLSLVQSLSGAEVKKIKAVDDVTLKLRRGEIFGLIGESGSGKTTIGKIAMKLHTPTDGTILYDGKDVTKSDKVRTEKYRRQVPVS